MKCLIRKLASHGLIKGFGNRYPLTDQDFKKSLGLDYADSVQNLRFHTVLHPSTPRCFDTFSRLRDIKMYFFIFLIIII
jgi:hypothetical protein